MIVRSIFGYLALWRCKQAWRERLPSQNPQ
jgi:hypothetical protein